MEIKYIHLIHVDSLCYFDHLNVDLDYFQAMICCNRCFLMMKILADKAACGESAKMSRLFGKKKL